MDGPYRDLGAGFARLTGLEGARRGPSRITHVEDALLELLRNARDAGATSVYVASSLRDRRYRTLTVIDDGQGLPETHKDLIFEPGVTTRHLNPISEPANQAATPHGAGLSLYHIKNLAILAEALSPSSPTSISITFDTRTLPERNLQSATRPSLSNLRATVQTFSQQTFSQQTFSQQTFSQQTFSRQTNPTRLRAYYGPPARILATLLDNRIIQPNVGAGRLRKKAVELGLRISLRTVQRILRGEVRPLANVGIGGVSKDEPGREESGRGREGDGPVLVLGEQERGEIAAILGRVVRAEYLEVEDVRFEARPGEIFVRARVYEPEEEYE